MDPFPSPVVPGSFAALEPPTYAVADEQTGPNRSRAATHVSDTTPGLTSSAAEPFHFAGVAPGAPSLHIDVTAASDHLSSSANSLQSSVYADTTARGTDYHRQSGQVSPGSILDLYARSPFDEASDIAGRQSRSLSTSTSFSSADQGNLGVNTPDNFASLPSSSAVGSRKGSVAAGTGSRAGSGGSAQALMLDPAAGAGAVAAGVHRESIAGLRDQTVPEEAVRSEVAAEPQTARETSPLRGSGAAGAPDAWGSPFDESARQRKGSVPAAIAVDGNWKQSQRGGKRPSYVAGSPSMRSPTMTSPPLGVAAGGNFASSPVSPSRRTQSISHTSPSAFSGPSGSRSGSVGDIPIILPQSASAYTTASSISGNTDAFGDHYRSDSTEQMGPSMDTVETPVLGSATRAREVSLAAALASPATLRSSSPRERTDTAQASQPERSELNVKADSRRVSSQSTSGDSARALWSSYQAQLDSPDGGSRRPSELQAPTIRSTSPLRPAEEGSPSAGLVKALALGDNSAAALSLATGERSVGRRKQSAALTESASNQSEDTSYETDQAESAAGDADEYSDTLQDTSGAPESGFKLRVQVPTDHTDAGQTSRIGIGMPQTPGFRSDGELSPGIEDIYTDANSLNLLSPTYLDTTGKPIELAAGAPMPLRTPESEEDRSSVIAADAHNRARDSVLLSDASHSDYGSDAHEEVLQRPPRRGLGAGSTTATLRSGHKTSSSLSSTEAADYLAGKYAPARRGTATPDDPSGMKKVALTEEEERVLEQQMKKEDDARDPSRPRTLQEAKRIAKERARLKSQADVAAAAAPETGGAAASWARPQRDPRRNTNEMPPAPQAAAAQDLSQSGLRERQVDQTSPSLPGVEPTAVRPAGMEELQGAVDATMQELSFASKASSDAPTLPAEQGRAPLLPRQSSLAPVVVEPAQLEAKGHFVAKNLKTPARIQIYGKTIPWPAAFDSSRISEQRRNAAWDRAKLYALSANALIATDTNLSAWLDAKRRPATAPVKSAPPSASRATAAAAYSRSARQEGSYAPSVRSEMTFPMRGDGGRANEITPIPAVALPSVAEITSPPSTLPYPGVLKQQRNTSSTNLVSLEQESLGQQPSSSDRSSGDRGASMRQQVGNMTAGAGNFFGGLKRRGSRREQNIPSGFAGLAKTRTNERPAGARGHVPTPSAPNVYFGGGVSSDTLPGTVSAADDLQLHSKRAVAGPRSYGAGRSPSPNKTSAGLRADSYVSPIAGLSPPSAAGAMYASTSSTDHSLDGSSLESGRDQSTMAAYNSARDRSASSAANNSARFETALNRVADVLPDADRNVLAGYLKRTGGDDLAAVSAYLQERQDSRRAR